MWFMLLNIQYFNDMQEQEYLGLVDVALSNVGPKTLTSRIVGAIISRRGSRLTRPQMTAGLKFPLSRFSHAP